MTERFDPRRPVLSLLLGMLAVALASCTSTTEAVPAPSETTEFVCTQVIGYSQVGLTWPSATNRRQDGWYVAEGVFESIVGDDHWQLLWHGGAGVDRWQRVSSFEPPGSSGTS